MNIVLGASGFIGSYLCAEMERQGMQYVPTGRSDRPISTKNSIFKNWEIVNVTSEADYEKLPKSNVESVVYLAAQLPAHESRYSEEAYFSTNILGTLKALQYAKRVGAKKFINTTSHSDVYELWDSWRAISELDERRICYKGDHAVYIIAKNAAVDLVEHYRQEYGIQTMSFRLPAVYGVGPHWEITINGKKHVTGFKRFIEAAQKGERIEVWGDWKKGRDLVYVKDVVNAYIGGMESDTVNGLYNIASGLRTTLEEEAKGIAKVFSKGGSSVEVVNIPEKPNSIHTYLYDISKAKRDLGYQVKYTYMAMLEDIREELAANRFPHLLNR